MSITEKLTKIEKRITAGIDKPDVSEALELMGAPGFPVDILEETRLYSEYLPKAASLGFTTEQKYLHFLWDALDKTPACLAFNFAVFLRRMIAKKLFKKCGKNFIAEENVRFNFGQNIEVGDDVFINRGVYLDSKGGISIGNSVGMAEGVNVFTHGHSESDHAERTYAGVRIEDYAKIYSFAVICPGITIGEEAIVGAKSLVTKDVEPCMMVGGTPAVSIRKRKNCGKEEKQLNHIWLASGAFQNE